MSLIDDIKPWADPATGMVQAADGGRDNLVVHTYRLVRRLSQAEREQITPIVNRFFYDCLIPGWPGLFHRYPGHTGEGSIDNLIGAALLSHALGLGFEHAILRHARRNFWVFNTESPGKIRWRPFKSCYWWKDWYWKHIGVPPMLKVICDEELTAFDRLAFRVSVWFLMIFNKGSSDLLLQDDINSVIYGHDDQIDELLHRFYLRFDIQSANSDYYGTNHPFAK